MAVNIKILNLRIISPFVTDIERGGNRTTIGVLPSFFKQISIETFVEIVYCIIKR